MKKVMLYVFASVLVTACEPRDRISKETFEQVNEAMEVKRLTEVEIIEEAMIWGDSIAVEAQSQLISALQKAVAEKGPAGALEFCNVNAISIVDDVSKRYRVAIRRVSNRNRNPNNLPDSTEKDILEAYEYAAENGDQSDPNIQKIAGGSVLLYTKAIVIPGGFCLNCHGEPGKEVDDAAAQRLAELYPQDKAINHKVGDLRGMWSIKIPKSEVVKRL